MKAPSRLLALIAAFVLCAHSPLAAAPDPFYTSLQEEGRLALERRDFVAAERALKVAAFGLLEEPAALASCLTLLALAQDGAKRTVAFGETVRRIAELEQRFGAYRAAGLAVATRTGFNEALRRNLTPSALAALPWYEAPGPVPAAAKKGQAGKKPARGESAAKPPAATTGPRSAAPPPVPREEASMTATTVAQVPEVPTPPARQSDAPAASAKPLPASEPMGQISTPPPAQELTRLRLAMNAARTVAEMKEVMRQTQELAVAHPRSGEVRRVVAESAYRASQWGIAAEQYAQIEFNPETEPLVCFYASVSFFETGKTAEAASLLRRCQPRLEATPAVTSYVERILGPNAGQQP